MGSVNRCWRCGRSLVVVAGETDLPPIRRAPVELATVPTASLVDEPGQMAETTGPGSPSHESATAAEVVGSAAETPVEPVHRTPIQPKYPKKVFAESCAITSVVVGVLTAITSILTAWSLLPALVGIGLGVVGLGSDRRKTAAVGIALCCLVVLISTGRASIWAYRVQQRRQLEMLGEF